MQQYFVQARLQLGQPLLLDAGQSHHILHVMRMKEGDVIALCDEQQMMLARISVHERSVQALPYELVDVCNDMPAEVTLIMSLIRGERFELVLQKAAELGCARVIPLQTRYCVARVPKEKAGKKLERWNAISSEACEQSRRLSRMKVCAPITLDDLPQVKSNLNLIAYEHADHRAQRLSFALRRSPFASLSIMIGCEGGFAPEEVALSEQAGFACVSLGPRILRAETAAIAVLAQIGYELESRGME